MDLSNKNTVRSSRTAVIVLKASGSTESVQSFPQSGVRFYIVDADTDASILIKTNKTNEELFTVGTGKEFNENQYFDNLELHNPNLFDVTIKLFAGWGNYIDNRTTIVGNRLSSILPTIEPETQAQFIAGATNTIAASTTIDLPAVAAGQQLRRKAIVVSNDDPATLLYVLDEDDNRICIVQPKTEITLPLSKHCKVQNPSASVVSATVSEIWWLKPVFVV